MQRIDTVIIGAGIIGIAIARRIAQTGREVIVIERERQFGAGTSSRNSEVIHAGIYYPTESLKARLCVIGQRQLYEFCTERGVPHRRCGKLIVATDPEQEAQLEIFASLAAANGVEDLERLGPAQVARLEPEIACTAALLSPSTGIVDSHALMATLLGEAEANGAVVAYRTSVQRIEALRDGFAVTINGEAGAALIADRLINAAGLHAPEVAGTMAGLPREHIPKPYWAKGSYFALAGAAPFRRLIYPVPEVGGLGVHATVDLAGRVRFGPDVEWCETLDYRVEEARAASFYAKIRRYWPGLRDGALAADYCGIRPKLSGPGEAAADFIISGPADHHVAGLVNLFGIESPGLTSALAIADEVEARLGD